MLVVGQKQLQRQLDLSHPAGGVDPGSQIVSDGGGGDRLLDAAALAHQRGDAGPAGLAQRFQTPGHEHPVLALQEHHIRHSAKAHHVGIGIQHRLLIAAQGGGQFEGHAHTA